MNGEGESGWSLRVGDWHVPTVLAVTVWFASAIAILGYIVTAFKETLEGADTLDANPAGAGVPASVPPGWTPPGATGPIDGAHPQGINSGAPAGPSGPIDGTGTRQGGGGQAHGPRNKPRNRGKWVASPDSPGGRARR